MVKSESPVTRIPRPEQTAPNITLSPEQFSTLLMRTGGRPALLHDVPVAEALAAWESWARAHLRQQTRDAYRAHFKALVNHAGVELMGQLTRQHIESWKLSLADKNSPRTVNNKTRMAGHLYKWIHEYHELDHADPFQRVRKFKEPRKWYKFLSAEEVERLLTCATECRGRRETDAMKGWNCWASIMLGFYAGFRRGEIAYARWEWFDWAGGVNGCGMIRVRPVVIDGKVLWEPKTSASAGDVPIHPQLRAGFYPHRKDAGWVIAPEKEQSGYHRYRYDGKRTFERACRKAGLEWVTWHVLRHSIASLMAEQGFSPHDIALMLRHQDTRCVSIYAHPRSERLDISRLKL